MQNFTRRQCIATAATLLLSPVAALAQNTDLASTVKIVVPFPAGGAVDVVARKIGEQMAKGLNRTVIVDNKPGAAGLIGIRAVAHTAGDGSTLLYAHSGLVTGQAMGAKFDLLKEFKPVAKLTFGPHLLVVRTDSPYKTQADLVNAMKVNPGKLNFGSGGAGSPTHLMYEMLEESIPGIKATHVPYKGAIDAVMALVSGDIDFQFALPGTSVEFIKSGKLRALSTTGAERLPLLPNLPTVAEAGAPGYRAEPWGGFLVPIKTPDSLVNVLAFASFAAVNTPEITQLVEQGGSRKAAKQTPAEFGAEIGRELTQQRTIVKRLGMVNE
jgi:tripartite-type tricarboxylate transporter receptor subunit TctC